MATRITRETLYLRHDFDDKERLQMGDDLAQAHNRMASIEEEEAVMKAQIKDRKAAVEQTIGSLYRNLNNRFEMRNVQCELKYDYPNVGEVTYFSEGDRIEKTRAMTVAERQMDLPLGDGPGDGVVVVVPPEKSAENIEAFFDKPAEPEPEAEAPAAEFAPGPGTEEFEERVRENMGAPEPFSEKPRLVDARPSRSKRKETPAVVAEPVAIADDEMNF